MTPKTFFERLQRGETNRLTYDRDGLHGEVTVWRFSESFMLMWQEMSTAEQGNEASPGRDVRDLFVTAEELLQFLEENDLPLADFKPE